MLNKSIILALLCLAGPAYANVIVNTTEDVSANDNVCSLREAITYINQYYSEQANENESQKEAREQIKNNGYQGCGGTSVTSNIILLETNKTYKLNSEVNISKALTIQTESAVTTDKEKGTDNALIQAVGKHRLFMIDDNDPQISQITVAFNQVNLQGCGSTEICSSQGGIIYNRERLTLSYVKLFGGYANQGGAIYSGNMIAGATESSASSVDIKNSIISNNKAQNGAAVYIAQPLITISFSVLRDNVNTSSGDKTAIVYSENPFSDETIADNNFGQRSYILNSTLFKNTGYLFNLRDGSHVNNVTAVDNSQGFSFNATAKKAYLSNSIVAANAQQDCYRLAGDNSLFYNNLVGSNSCPAGETNNLNVYLSDITANKLFAGSASEGLCDKPPAEGLLCPYHTPDKTFLGFFKPRLLVSYSSINDSPIVNRGRLYSDGSTQSQFSCQAKDQRQYTRESEVHCDLGSIELSAGEDIIELMGDTIKYGEVARMYIRDNLADGELLPASECNAALGAKLDPLGQPWTEGCMRVEQDSLITPLSKGHLTLTDDGYLLYTPNSNWHGSDKFSIRVVTTASRFSESINDRDIVIPVQIVQEPNETMQSDKLKVSGGALGGYSVIGLILLARLRRMRA